MYGAALALLSPREQARSSWLTNPERRPARQTRPGRRSVCGRQARSHRRSRWAATRAPSNAVTPGSVRARCETVGCALAGRYQPRGYQASTLHRKPECEARTRRGGFERGWLCVLRSSCDITYARPARKIRIVRTKGAGQQAPGDRFRTLNVYPGYFRVLR